MEEEQYYPIVNLVETSLGLKDAFVEAKEDGKIRPWEWFKLVREASDIVKAVRKVEADDIVNINNIEIDVLSYLVMDSINKDVKFTREDVVSVLKIAREFAKMIDRHTD